MPEESLELIRRVYRAMNARDAESAERLLSDDVEWIPDRRVGEGPIRGRRNVVEFFLDRGAMFDEFRHEVEALRGKEHQVLALVRVTGRGAGSGADFEIRIAHLWTTRNGLVIRGQGFGNRDEALEAAGLSE